MSQGTPTTTTKAALAKAYFSRPEQYLNSHADIRVRCETVREFVRGEEFGSMLDIGCGSGEVTLPLLSQCRTLTLIDFSPEMLSIAQANVPPGRTADVDLLCGDFLSIELPERKYDLIVCLGVLAHIDSPSALIAKMVRLLAPGGSIIVQNTDHTHLVNRLRDGLRALLRKASNPYHRTHVTNRQLNQLLGSHGLKILQVYRYNMALPPMGKLLSEDGIYVLMRRIYGEHPHNRRSWIGGEYICRFSLSSAASSDVLAGRCP